MDGEMGEMGKKKTFQKKKNYENNLKPITLKLFSMVLIQFE